MLDTPYSGRFSIVLVAILRFGYALSIGVICKVYLRFPSLVAI
jgi:hypothetical protein